MAATSALSPTTRFHRRE